MPINLLPGEALTLNDPAQTPHPPTADEAIEQRYSRGEVRIVTDQARTQLAELPTVLSSGRWELQPDYQRRLRWSQGRQSRLIESFLMNVPVPPIFLYEYEYSKYEVMDGLQRLTALKDFYHDNLKLSELEYWPELEGRTYSTLPPKLRQGIDRRYLSSIVLLYETASDDAQAEKLKQLVFERINSGGERLTPQESRNALSKGPLNTVLPRLARTPSFCRCWGIPEPSSPEDLFGPSEDVLQNERFRQMEDVEMVLRFFAHRQRAAGVSGRRLKEFLDDYWSKANRTYTIETVNKIGEIFVQTCDLAEAVLGEKAFFIRRNRGGKRSWIPRPTLLAYDSIMSSFSKFLTADEILIERRTDVVNGLADLYDENAAAFDGRKTDPTDLAKRDELMEQLLKRIIGG